jgi:hypothetical protein
VTRQGTASRCGRQGRLGGSRFGRLCHIDSGGLGLRRRRGGALVRLRRGLLLIADRLICARLLRVADYGRRIASGCGLVARGYRLVAFGCRLLGRRLRLLGGDRRLLGHAIDLISRVYCRRRRRFRLVARRDRRGGWGHRLLACRLRLFGDRFRLVVLAGGRIGRRHGRITRGR